MSPDRVRNVLAQKPFKPFVLHTGDGEKVRVSGPEMALLLPGGRTLFVATGRQVNGDDEVKMIDVFLVSQITSPAPGKNGRSKKH